MHKILCLRTFLTTTCGNVARPASAAACDSTWLSGKGAARSVTSVTVSCSLYGSTVHTYVGLRRTATTNAACTSHSRCMVARPGGTKHSGRGDIRVASQARQSFDKNSADVERLLAIHGDITGSSRGRRYGVEVLNKAAVVLITAFWEAYCEDIAAEGLRSIVENAPSSATLPKDLQKAVAAELKKEDHDLAIWALAGDGWRQVLRDRLERMTEERNKRLNTPKAVQIDELFLKTLGIPKISSAWNWPNMTAETARQKLDDYVTLRGAIAHRGTSDAGVHKAKVEDYYEFVKKLVGKTGGRVNKYVNEATGKRLWL